MRLSTTQPCRISQATFMTSQCVSSLSCCHRFSRWLSFFRMVWIDTTHAVSSPFASFSYSVFKEPRWCFGVSHRVTVNLSFSVVSLPFVRSLCLHCSTLFLHCQEVFPLVLSVVLSVCRELVAHRVHTVRCSEFFHHAIHTCSTDSIFRIGAVCLAVFRPCHPWLSILYHDVPTPSSTNLKFFGEKFCSHCIPYPRRVSWLSTMACQ